LLINARTGQVRFLAQATAPKRRELVRSGGLATLPASGREAVLDPTDIAKLVALAADAPKHIPALKPKRGQVIPADIEFGFRQGDLALLQLRPFVENKNAQKSQYLTSLDRKFQERGTLQVLLDQVP
jgi:hypothetical protein